MAKNTSDKVEGALSAGASFVEELFGPVAVIAGLVSLGAFSAVLFPNANAGAGWFDFASSTLFGVEAYISPAAALAIIAIVGMIGLGELAERFRNEDRGVVEGDVIVGLTAIVGILGNEFLVEVSDLIAGGLWETAVAGAIYYVLVSALDESE